MNKYLFHVGSIIIILIFIFSGCSYAPASTAASVSPIVSATTIPTETPTIALTATPSPGPTFSPRPSSTSTLSWPSIDSLTLKDGTYYYDKGNLYGGKEGDVAGVTRDNVYVEGKQTGGICFTPEVCRVLLNNELKKIANGQLKVKVITPLDISGFDGKVEISTSHRQDSPEITALKIECNVQVPVVSTTDAKVLDSGVSSIGRLILNQYAAENYNANLAYNNVTLVSDGADFNEKEGYSDVFWGKQLLVKDADSTIIIVFSAKDHIYELSTNDLLIEDGKVIFMSVG